MEEAMQEESREGDRAADVGEGAGPKPDIAGDLRELGENLREALRAAWTSRERLQLQSEIEQGLSALGSTLAQTFDAARRDLRSSARVRERVAEARQKVSGVREELRPGQVGDRARAEIHEVLERVNDQLRRSRERWTPSSGSPQGGPEDEPK